MSHFRLDIIEYFVTDILSSIVTLSPFFRLHATYPTHTGHLRISEQHAQYRSATAIGYRPRRAAGIEGEEARSVDTRRCIVPINEPHAPKVPLSEVHAAFRGLPLREKPVIQLTLQVRRAAREYDCKNP